jgi:hypothetical protein
MNTQMKTLNSNTCRILFATFLSALCLIALSTQAATITVTNTNDSSSGSLRQAVADAVDGDTINFSSSLNGQTITLTSGELLVDKSVAISGPGANTLAVDANHASRVFYIASGKTVTISGLSITNGTASPPVPSYSWGGGIYNDHATLTLSNCTISGNSTPTDSFGQGGGIFNDGSFGSAPLTVSNCTISGNSAVPGTGGGITNYSGTLTITNSTLSGNTAQDGGGISNYGNPEYSNVTVTNSTLSGNSAAPGYGGAISNTGTLKIGDTILNAAPSGVNIYNLGFGTLTSLGYNLSSDNGGGYLTVTGDQINTDPRLGPLQDNGGPTFTHLPASNSPGIDSGDPTPAMDQRGPGFVRVVNGRIDIGAVEAQAIPTPTPTPTPPKHGHGHH